MNDSLTTGQISHDAELGQWIVALGPTGPAGDGTVELAPGVQVMVDVARPDRTCRVDVDAIRPDTPMPADAERALVELVGPFALDVLRRAWPKPRRFPLDPMVPTSAPHHGRMRPAGRVGRVAALEGLAAAEPDEPLWLLELAWTAAHTDWPHLAATVDVNLHRLAGRLVDAADADAPLPPLTAAQRRTLDEMVAWLARSLDDRDLAGEVERLGVRLLARPPRPLDPASPASRSSGARGLCASPPDVHEERHGLAGEVRAVLRPGLSTGWVCAFDGDLLVGLGPVIDDGGERATRLVVPEGRRVRYVATDDPAAAAQSPRLRQHLASTALGRRAAHLERVGRWADAAIVWGQCARRWDDAGHADRATLARAYGAQCDHPASRQPGPHDHLGAPLPVPHPFLADLAHQDAS